MKKQVDEEQRKENLENRKKAIQRIKEHKIVRLHFLLFIKMSKNTQIYL